MKYSKEERLIIGKRIYDSEISKQAAAEEYGITINTARDYMRLYRDENHLPGKTQEHKSFVSTVTVSSSNLNDYEAMTKDELIRELVRARITEARLKKGYEVKGDGSVILYGSKNIK